MINAGTVAAFLTLDTEKFDKGIKGANAQLLALGDDNMKMRDKLNGVGSALTDIGRTMTTHVTLPLAGAGLAALNVAANFDEGMSKVAAISGATGDELDALRDKAREMGAKTKFSATEAADAMSYMAMAGWKTEEMLGGIEGIMSLAAASGEDLATTSDIVTDALTAFGLKAKDSGHFADVLAAASSNANTNVSLMGETFKYVAPVAGALGISAEDTALATGLMANAGIKASQAGTALRSIFTRLSTDAGASANGLGALGILTEKLGVQFYDSEGKVRDFSDVLNEAREKWKTLSAEDSSLFAQKIAGKNGISGWLALMNASAGDVDKLASAIENCDGTAAKMAETMQGNLKGQLTILKSQTEELAISIGSELMPYANSAVSAAQGLVDKFNSLDSGSKRLIVNAGLVAAAIGPVSATLGKVNSGIGALITSGSAAKAAFTAAGGGLAGFGSALVSVITPAGLVVAGLAAVVGVVGAIYLANRDATKGTRELGEAMKGASKYADEFRDGLDLSSGVLDEFTAELNAGFNLNDVKTKIKNVQDKITAITSKAHSERRQLTQKEIDKLHEYLDELRTLTDSEFEYYNSNLSGLKNVIDLGLEMTEESSQQVLSNAKANQKEALSLAWQSYLTEMSYIANTTKEGSEERRKQSENAKAHYDEQVKTVNDSYAEIVSAVTNAYFEQNVQNSEFYAALQQYNADVEAENQRHNDRIAKIQEIALSQPMKAAELSRQEQEKHNRIMDKLNGQLAKSFDDNAQKIVGTFSAMVTEVDKSNGLMTSDATQFATDFVACYDNLPEKLRKKMDSAVEGMRRALNQGKAKVLRAAETIASGVGSVMSAALKINSPSKVTMAIGESVTEGMELGMNKGKDSLYRTASDISLDTAEVLAGVSQARYNYQTPATDYGDRLDRLLDAVERLVASEPVMQIDGRPFGRLVRSHSLAK